MQAPVSSVNWALKLNPSLPKNSLALGRSLTGRLTNILVFVLILFGPFCLVPLPLHNGPIIPVVSSVMADDDFSERLGLFVIMEGINGFLEGKHPSDDRFKTIHTDGAIHRNELSPITRKNHSQRGNRVVKHIDVNFRGAIG